MKARGKVKRLRFAAVVVCLVTATRCTHPCTHTRTQAHTHIEREERADNQIGRVPVMWFILST